MTLNDISVCVVIVTSNISELYTILSQKLKLLIKITQQLSGDTTVDDLGDISMSLDCFTSNFS